MLHDVCHSIENRFNSFDADHCIPPRNHVSFQSGNNAFNMSNMAQAVRVRVP